MLVVGDPAATSNIAYVCVNNLVTGYSNSPFNFGYSKAFWRFKDVQFCSIAKFLHSNTSFNYVNQVCDHRLITLSLLETGLV